MVTSKCSSKHYNNHSKSDDDSYSYKMKLIMSENNTNKNLRDNLISQNVNCHSQCNDQILYYNMST
jgi:predicted metal-binding protein